MKILIINEVSNSHRNPIFSALANTLRRLGVSVKIICEREILIRYQDAGPFYYFNNDKSIRDIDFNEVAVYETFSSITELGYSEANEKRYNYVMRELEVFNPDHIIVWSGCHYHQCSILSAISDKNFLGRTLFCEVAWFSQKEHIYVDTHGVNYKSSLLSHDIPELNSYQKQVMDLWAERYKTQRIGAASLKNPRPVIFVPLQVDTDSSIKTGSPFSTMQEFVHFLEAWIPQGYQVILKGHPKAKYPYVLYSKRTDFLITFSGNINNFIADADIVVGINSTVLLESALLGKKVVSFGKGLFSGRSICLEANTDSNAEEIFKQVTCTKKRDSFFYHLIFERQISIQKLKANDTNHLLSRFPFNRILGQLRSQSNINSMAAEGKSMLKVGKSKIARTASLDCEQGGQIIIGDGCEVRHHAVLEVSGGYNGIIQFGNDCVIGVGDWIQGSGKVTVGNNVIIGPYVAIVSTNHQYEDPDQVIAKQPLVPGEVVIEDDVWIGAHCTIAYNVRIGAHSIIAANSFVNKDVPPYSIVGGSPAKLLKNRK